jgi:hypothetical protein
LIEFEWHSHQYFVAFTFANFSQDDIAWSRQLHRHHYVSFVGDLKHHRKLMRATVHQLYSTLLCCNKNVRSRGLSIIMRLGKSTKQVMGARNCCSLESPATCSTWHWLAHRPPSCRFFYTKKFFFVLTIFGCLFVRISCRQQFLLFFLELLFSYSLLAVCLAWNATKLKDKIKFECGERRVLKSESKHPIYWKKIQMPRLAATVHHTIDLVWRSASSTAFAKRTRPVDGRNWHWCSLALLSDQTNAQTS